jgi:ArsR family transcriptional regulator, arsenate/arsenite/antimonite-responsive transcriptional repressor
MDARQFQRIAKALADPKRYEILSRIASAKEMACSDMRCDIGVSAATLSHHIKELETAGLIEVRKDAKYLYMKLCRRAWKDYMAQLAKL